MSELLHLRLTMPTEASPEELAAVVASLESAIVQPSEPFDMDRWGDPALILQDVSFDGRVHARKRGREWMWIDDGKLFVAAQIVNFRSQMREGGATTRLHAVIEALNGLAAGTDGAILGGWNTDHLGNTHPVILHGGRLLLCYGHGNPDKKPYVDFDQHGPTVVVEAIHPGEDGIHARLDHELIARMHRG